jgi:serine/threonine-protein kinase RsbW
MQNHEELDLMDLPEGGFGWFMIHSLCKEISFEREHNRNCLTMTFGAKSMNLGLAG